MNWKRLSFAALGVFILAQGIGSLNHHHLVYWNVARNLVLYPETQIVADFGIILVAVLPLGRIIEHLTGLFIESRHPRLKQFWKRHHHENQEPPSVSY